MHYFEKKCLFAQHRTGCSLLVIGQVPVINELVLSDLRSP